MNILIAYGTKYGTVEKCANKLASLLSEEAEVVNLKKSKDLDLSKFEIIIIGGSVRMGKIHPEVKKFCSDNLGQLLHKKIGLFLCGIIEENRYMEEFNTSFPKELIDISYANGFFGGEICMDKLNFIERPIIKKVLKTDIETYKIHEENIKIFASQVDNLIISLK
jgi:menaquinone-dependent protoporphyrinogen oxidase